MKPGSQRKVNPYSRSRVRREERREEREAMLISLFSLPPLAVYNLNTSGESVARKSPFQSLDQPFYTISIRLIKRAFQIIVRYAYCRIALRFFDSG